MAKTNERILRILRELQKRTQEAGCTEAEALAAAEKMGRLMEEHDIEVGEIGMREEASGATKRKLFAADDYAGTLITGLKHFCSLITYIDHNERGVAACYVIFGMEHDLEIATYLYEICAEAMDEEWHKFMDRNGYSMKKRQSFRMGFANRVYRRLLEMKAERDARTYQKTGTSLVVVKDAIVKSEFDKLGIKLNKARVQQAADMGAYYSGQAAGSRVNLNNPLTGGVGTDPALR